MNAALVHDCPGCHRPTRPPRSKAADYPGTTARRHGYKCRICYGRSGPQYVDPNHLAYTIAGLASFLERRNERAEAMARRAYYEERMSA